MSNSNVSDLPELIRKIEKNQILLPDFQRKFVWTDETQQRKLVASILSKMPIGSILLLKSKAKEYSSKTIGCKNNVILDDEQEVEFLLDGQQRMTVLTNVFSDMIHTKCSKVSDLVSESLKRRFFLRVPRWESVYLNNAKDLFGLKEFKFKFENPDSEDPDFLSGDIYDEIISRNFLKSDNQPFSPYVDLSTNLDSYCTADKEGYLIPLFLLIPPEGKRKMQSVLRYNDIMETISTYIKNEICNYWAASLSDEQQKLLDLFFDKTDIIEIQKNDTLFESKIREKAFVWTTYFKNYLTFCIKNIVLNQIVVSENKRDRAIDIYENLNRGGVSLNTFDLIMAKVAKVSKENFYERMIKYLDGAKTYSKDVLPDSIASLAGKQIDDRSLNAASLVACYDKDKNEITSIFIDIFLDVLSLICYNPSFAYDGYKIDFIKKDKILRLTAEQIDQNAEKVANAIDRAFFFLTTRCGIRKIREINNNLIVVIIAVILYKDEWYSDKKVFNTLEAWYWSSIFGGAYDKDQNTVFINHLERMIKIISQQDDNSWIKDLSNYVLNMQNYSDKDFLLMKKVAEDRYPKTVMRGYFCQYMLSNTYVDLFDSTKQISVFSPNFLDLEAHHIIPIGSIKKMGELTDYIRKNPKSVVNSPLNFILITKKANKDILELPLSVYEEKICSEARSALCLATYNKPDVDENNISDILEHRFNYIQGIIKNEIQMLLN